MIPCFNGKEFLKSFAYSGMVLPGITTRGRTLINIMKNRGPNT